MVTLYDGLEPAKKQYAGVATQEQGWEIATITNALWCVSMMRLAETQAA